MKDEKGRLDIKAISLERRDLEKVAILLLLFSKDDNYNAATQMSLHTAQEELLKVCAKMQYMEGEQNHVAREIPGFIDLDKFRETAQAVLDREDVENMTLEEAFNIMHFGLEAIGVIAAHNEKE